VSPTEAISRRLLDHAATNRLCRRIQIPRVHVNRACTEPFVAFGRLVAATRWHDETKRELWLLDGGRLGVVTRSGTSAIESRWDLGIDGTARLDEVSLDEAATVFAVADVLTVD
jgi:hypothetical protein